MSRDLNKFPKVLKIGAAAIAGTLSLGGLYFFNGQKESFHNNFVLPILHKLDPELSHKIAILALSHCYLAPNFNEDHHMLRTHIKTLNLNNPIGLAAGFDKDGKAVPNLEKIGFGFVEVGSITPKPQPGNPPLRLFRLPEDKAIINRYGFNSVGHDKALRFLKVNKNNHYSEGVVGINLGVNKDSKDPIMDYVQGIRKFTDVADYYVINISSPNTPGLRNLQQKQQLESVLLKVLEARDTVKKKIKPLIFLKLSPDLTSEERHDIASIILQPQYRVDGLIISNTTIQRDPTLKNSLKKESGGLSGLPLKQRSTEMIAEMYKLTKGSIPIIGVGGIFTGADAFEKIKAGASAVQIYTSFVYHGIPIVEKIKQELVECLKNEKYKYVHEAVGKGVDLES